MRKLILKSPIVLLLMIIVLAGYLRFYRLEDYPIQLNHDEVSQLYDAISIATTGKDIYGNFLPTIFESVHDFKSPFYTYITALFYLIFGGGELTVRLPGAFFSTLIIMAIYFFSWRLFKNQIMALLASLMAAIVPFELFFGRKSFENVAGIFFMLLGFTALLKYFENKKSVWVYLGVIILSIAMYTYFSHAIIIPLLFISFIFIFKDEISWTDSNFIKAIIFWIILILPLVFLVITNPDARYRSETVFITQDVNLGERIGLTQTGNFLLDNVVKLKVITDYGFNRYLNQFDPLYIFSFGLDFTNQGPVGMGPLFLVQLPFLIFGLIYITRQNNIIREKRFILTWVILGMIPSGLTFESFSPHRSIMVFTALNIISAAGLFFVFKYLNNLPQKRIFYISIITIFLLFTFNFVYFIHMYTVNFPNEKFQHLHYPFEQVARFMWSEHQNYDRIVFDPLYGEVAPVIGTAAHYYLAYFGNYPPAKMQQEYRRGEKTREVLFDKFSIRKIDWIEDQNLKNTLIVGTIWSIPIKEVDENKIIKTFYYFDGKPAFYAVSLK